MTEKQFWTTRELRSVGQTAAAIDGAVRRGDIHRITRGLYSTQVPTDSIRLRGLARMRRGLVYIGDTAAHLHGLAPMRWPAQASVPRGTSPDGGELLDLRTSTTTPRTTRVDGVPVLSPLAAAVDATMVDVHALRAFLRRSYTGVKGNERLAEDLAALPPARRAAAAELTGDLITGTASNLELMVVRAVVVALDGMEVTVEVNRKIRGYYFDIVVPEADVCIEIDSWRYHSAKTTSPANFVKDRWKGNAVVRWGWTLLRYPDASIDLALDEVVEEIRATVAHNLANPRTRKLRVRELPTDRPVWLWHPEATRFG